MPDTVLSIFCSSLHWNKNHCYYLLRLVCARNCAVLSTTHVIFNPQNNSLKRQETEERDDVTCLRSWSWGSTLHRLEPEQVGRQHTLGGHHWFCTRVWEERGEWRLLLKGGKLCCREAAQELEKAVQDWALTTSHLPSKSFQGFKIPKGNLTFSKLGNTWGKEVKVPPALKGLLVLGEL